MKKNCYPFSRKTIVHVMVATIVASSLSSCQLPLLSKGEKSKNDDKEAEAASADVFPEPKMADLSPEVREVNDVARYLAGLPALGDESTNKKWRSEDFWKAHRTGMDKMWKEFASKRGAKVKKWSGSELADVATVPVVFQPFGGPDFVFSQLLFPKAETFVVCGKAPCIDIPKLDAIQPAMLADIVFTLRQATAVALRAEGEATSGIPVAPQTTGALPMLLAFGARTGHVIESVELMPNDGSQPGQMPLDLPDAGGQSKRSQPSSACVVSMRAADGSVRRLFYFQQDLTDDGLPESAALLRYLNKQSRVAVVVNESAHELHQPNTLRIQKYIASHAAALIQDPSGVPYRHFSLEAWNIQRYGNYTGAPAEYVSFNQPELIAAYNDKSTVHPLPFGAGPLRKESTAALMIARPLVTKEDELPVNVDVTPLAESNQELPAPKTAAPPASAPAVETPASPAPTISSTEPLPNIPLDPNVGGPLAPIDLAPPK